MNLILPISHKQVEHIFLGLDKAIFKKDNPLNIKRGDRIYLYEARANKSIVGYAIVSSVKTVSTSELMTYRNMIKSLSDRDLSDLNKTSNHFGYLFFIQSPVRYNNIKVLEDFGVDYRPFQLPLKL